MSTSAQQIIIRRYANRRLYNTRTRQFISRKSLEVMARSGQNFVVLDSITGDDITHAVLGQVIVAQEAVQAEPLLPTEFMRRLIGFYGDTLGTLLACYLDFSLLTLRNETVRQRMTEAGNSTLALMNKQVQQNIRLFEAFLSTFSPSQAQTRAGEADQDQ